MEDIKIDLQALTAKLQQALQDKNAGKAAIVYDKLFDLLSPFFQEEDNIHQLYLCYGEALAIMLKYLVHNNFYEKAHGIVSDIEKVVGLAKADEQCAKDDFEQLTFILNEAKQIVKAVPEKHRNLIIP